jgi:two-component system, NtrC family, sensor histidine kinase HydH
MERVLTAGAELAEQTLTMRGSSHTQPAECPATAPPARKAWRDPWNVLPATYFAAVVAVLAATGYPAWRIGVVALAAAVQQVTFFGWRKRDIRRCVNAENALFVRIVVRAQTSFLLTTGATVAVTGGVRSPLLPTLLTAYLAAVAATGDQSFTRLLLGATALVVALLAMLPPAATGPELAGSAYVVLTVLGVLGVGALLSPVHLRTRRRSQEFARWRKEVASEALARAQSLEQVGARVAHELKNPLTGVKALVQLGLRSPAEAASHERLEVVEKEVTRMQEILHNYLSFTRPLQSVAPRRVEVGSLVSDTLVVLAARADDAGIRLYAQGDASVDADPRRLKEALLNLVANASEATPPGGEVVVDVRPAGEEVEIVVRDNGRGMPAETLRRIGTPFFTTRDDGTGLGVVLARSVIAQHGGTLRYDSQPGKGTNVRVTLPRLATGKADAARIAGG